MNETPRPYRLGTPDINCRYPVHAGAWFLGWAFRWHGTWWAIAAGTGEETRVADGGPRQGGGVDAVASHLHSEFMAGRIAPQQAVDSAAAEPARPEDVPLLHPRMPETARNIAAAEVALTGLAEHRWTPYGGYPGSDNPWYMECQLCGWKGPRYWSHLRGRNGMAPSVHRHEGGCIGADAVREAIAAYRD
ncbi:hypothetical protein ACIBL8_47880 [Streptomyces sp. NPDC050523]|uniref:hypothetical protein n=1 Tax=Streptomyces sp. NPDC050523 TaxID=3365622 RepID=UPI00379683CE